MRRADEPSSELDERREPALEDWLDMRRRVLVVRMLSRIGRGAGEGPSVSLLGDVAMKEDVAWGGGGDDIFGDTGVRTSKTEDLTKMGMLMDDDGVERYHRCLESAVSQLPTTVHWH